MENIGQRIDAIGPICEVHQKQIRKICTEDGSFLCQQCEFQHKEHIVKSLAFVAEEISEQLRVKMVQNERVCDTFQQTLKDISEKFKRSNIKTVLIAVMEMIKQIIKTFDRSQVLEECTSTMDQFKIQIEKIKSLSKKVKGGDKQCIEVIQQKKDIDDIIMNINKERGFIEKSLSELSKINEQDFEISLGDTSQQETLKQRLQYSIIELIREKNQSLATLLAPQGIAILNADQVQSNINEATGFELNSIFTKSQSSFVDQMNQSQISGFNRQAQSNSFQLIQTQIQEAHADFINSIVEVNDDYYATASSDYKVNLWSKQSFHIIESFNLGGEVVSLAKAANEILVCGMINGGIGLIDTGLLKVKQVFLKAHTGTVIACIALRQAGRQIVVTQDDSREIKVWNIDDFTNSIIKTIGRSYNPVWYVQSLIELVSDNQQEAVIASACGNEMKVNKYRINVSRKEIIQDTVSTTKGIPTALIQLNSQYYACSSCDQIEFFDIQTGQNVQSILANKGENSYESILTLAALPVSQDKDKKYLFAAGANRIIYVFKVDLLLKCASLPITTLETSHTNTIVSMSTFRQYDKEGYLITIAIDKCQGIFNIQQPQGKNSPAKSGGLSKFDHKKQSDSERQIKSGIMVNNDLNNLRDKNTACCCIF